MAERREIVAALAALGLIFGEIGAESLSLYHRALADMPSAALAGAVDELIREHERYFPTPAEIRHAAPGAGIAAKSDSVGIPYFPPAPRSLEEIAENRRRVAPLWSEVRRVLNGGELRPFGEVLADLDAGRLGLEDASSSAPSAPRDEAAIRTQIAAWERELAADG